MPIDSLADGRTRRILNPRDVEIASLLFGSRRLYEAFVDMLNDGNMHIKEEDFDSIVKKVTGVYNEMFYELRNGPFIIRIFRNILVVRDYRKKLKQDPIIGPYIERAKSYLKNKN